MMVRGGRVAVKVGVVCLDNWKVDDHVNRGKGS